MVNKEDIVEVAYTGDTVLSPLLDQDLVLKAKLLIIECTYLEGDLVWAHKWHHIHIQDLVQNADKFLNEKIILNHVSRKYKGAENILRLIKEAFVVSCPDLIGRIGVTLRGFGR